MPEQFLPKGIAEQRVKIGVPLAAYTTMQVGGPADYFFEPEDAEELKLVLASATAAELPYLVLGGGSNLVIHDRGFRGLVIYLKANFQALRTLDARESENVIAAADSSAAKADKRIDLLLQKPFDYQHERLIYAQSGVATKALALYAARAGLGGLEFASGIPGTVGGALFMNAGAYGREMAQVCLAANYMDKDGGFGRVYGRQQRFSYRHSLYRQEKHLIIGGIFRLPFADMNAIQQQMDELNARRSSTQPLEWPSSGSVFKRPEGLFAGKLIMDAGLKGKRIGGAEVSSKHAGFIVNRGGASAEDVRALVAYIQAEVMRRNGLLLEPEIRVLDEYGRNLFHSA